MKCSLLASLAKYPAQLSRKAGQVIPVLKFLAVLLTSLSMTANVWAAKGGSTSLPAAPSGLTATAVSSNQIRLAWVDNSTSESGFKIEQAPTSSGPWKQVGTVGANVAVYNANGLAAATTYYFRVRAYTSRGNSGYTTVASATTQSASAPCTYTVSSSSSPVGGGTISGGGTVSCGSSVTVTASPGTGYNFASWTEGGTVVSTSASYTFAVGSNRSLLANFTLIPCMYTISTSSSGGGTTTGGGTINCGSSVTVTATPASCFGFVNWTANGTVVSTSPIYTSVPTANRTLVANFAQITYAISSSSSPSVGGTTLGGGVFNCGSSVTLTASPNSGYNFANWTENGIIVSTSSSFGFTATANRTLVANFTAIPCNYTIITSSSPSAGGTSVGGGTVNCGSSVTVSASANSGYSFANWTENGTVVSTTASYAFTAGGNRTLVANFTAVPCTYTIAASSSPSAGGTASGGGSVNCGSSVTVSATPSACYSFVNWTENGTTVSTAASYTFTANASRNLVANFAQVSYTISTSVSAAGGGSASGPGTVACGTSTIVTATAASCYRFVNWTENGTVVSTLASYSFAANASRNLVANFAPITYTVSTTTSPSVGGSVNGGGTVNCGSTLTLTASANSGYSFANWTENGTVISASASYVFTAAANRTLVANFTAVPCTYTIAASSSPSAGGTAVGGGAVNCGASATVTATPSACYSFVNWTENGTTVSTSASYTFTASASRNLVANFSPSTYTISTTSSPSAGGTGSGGGTVNCGASVTVSATSASCYSFVSWTENGTVVSTSANYTFTANAGRNLVANFAQVSYAINTSVSAAGGGSVAGPGTVVCGSSTTVTATAASCYRFVNWTENGTVVSTSAGYSFTANASRNLVANFTPTTYTISTGSSPSAGGTVNGGGTVNCGSSVTVGAAAASCYSFVSWTENGTVVSTTPTFTFAASASRSLVANFAQTTYTITPSSSPSGGGTVGGGGTVNCGSSVTVSASPASCYTFASWTENGTVVSTTSTFTFPASANRSLVANFTQTSYTVGTSVLPSSSGTVSGGGTAGCGASVTVIASPSTGYTFANWTESGSVVSGSANYTFTANGNRTLVANFSPTPCTYSLSASSASYTAASAAGNVNVTASAGTCSWAASTVYNWIHTTSSGIGSGTASYGVDANTSLSQRSGTITIAGQTFTVTQSGHSVPVANAGGNQTATVGTVLNFNGSSSTARDGATIASYAWAFGDLGSASGMSVSHAYSAAGTFVVTLTVSDSFGSSGSSTATIIVTNPTAPLTVNLTAPTSGATVSNTVSLGAAASSTATRVEFYCDNLITPLGSATAAPFSFPCDTTVMPNGSHNFYCKAYDAAGSSATSPSVAVNVNNQALPSGVWAKRFGSTGTDYGAAVTLDANGNILVAGVFSGSVDFGGGILTSAGGYDIFLAKYSPSGAHLWSKQFGGAGSEVVKCIALDASGNIFIGGSLLGGSLMKLDSSGNLQWTKGPVAVGLDNVSFASIAVDSQGNIVATGSFVAGYLTPLDFGDSHPLTSSAGSTDAFLAKYSPTGTCLWAKDFVNWGDTEYGTGVAVDKRINPSTGRPYDTILIAGYAFSGIDLGGGDMENGAYGAYGFLGKIQPDGTYNAALGSWERMIGIKGVGDPTSAFARLQRMAIDGNGDVVVGGEWNYQADFGGGMMYATASFNNLYLAKYAGTDGHYLWLRPINGSYGGSAGSVATDGQNNILFTGQFTQTYNFGAQSLTSANAPNTFATGDCYVAKYSSAGAPVWAKQFGGTDNDSGTSVAVDSSGNSVVTGAFNNNLDGSPATFGSQSLTSAGGLDGFLLKLNP